jgi:hypothetical protein
LNLLIAASKLDFQITQHYYHKLIRNATVLQPNNSLTTTIIITSFEFATPHLIFLLGLTLQTIAAITNRTTVMRELSLVPGGWLPRDPPRLLPALEPMEFMRLSSFLKLGFSPKPFA